jgi:hypothetical protein
MSRSVVTTTDIQVCLSRHVHTDKTYAELKRAIAGIPTTQNKIFEETTRSLIWDNTQDKSVRLYVKFLGDPNIKEKSELTLAREQHVMNVVNREINEANFANIKFKFVTNDNAHIRITMYSNQGSWCAIGKDALEIVDQEVPTMNLSWMTQGNILHQFGHAMGFMHENKTLPDPNIWNKEIVEAAFAALPHFWNNKQTQKNFFDVFNVDQFLGFNSFDSDSLMRNIFPCLFFKFTPPTEILPCTGSPSTYEIPQKYSDGDKKAFARYYPIGENQAVVIPLIREDDWDDKSEWARVDERTDTSQDMPVLDIEQRRDIPDSERSDHRWVYTLLIILAVIFCILILSNILLLRFRCNTIS